MPTKRTKRVRTQGRRITPAALEAFKAGDPISLHRALGLKPWDRSPLDIDLAVKPPTEPRATAYLQTWPQAYELREALEAALRSAAK